MSRSTHQTQPANHRSAPPNGALALAQHRRTLALNSPGPVQHEMPVIYVLDGDDSTRNLIREILEGAELSAAVGARRPDQPWRSNCDAIDEHFIHSPSHRIRLIPRDLWYRERQSCGLQG